jgi:hypothetical protein
MSHQKSVPRIVAGLAAVCATTALAVLPGTPALADPNDEGYPDPSCSAVSVDGPGNAQVFGAICTHGTARNPHTGFYSSAGSPGALVTLGLRVTGGGRVLGIWPEDEIAMSGDGDAVTRDWTDQPFRAGYCYAGMVLINGRQFAGPDDCH